jgi:hypothetical protein
MRMGRFGVISGKRDTRAISRAWGSTFIYRFPPFNYSWAMELVTSPDIIDASTADSIAN